jgi:hypothetical protein
MGATANRQQPAVASSAGSPKPAATPIHIGGVAVTPSFARPSPSTTVEPRVQAEIDARAR